MQPINEVITSSDLLDDYSLDESERVLSGNEQWRRYHPFPFTTQYVYKYTYINTCNSSEVTNN